MRKYALLACLFASPSYAWNTPWDTRYNPDKFPSIGLDLSKGQAAGIPRAGVGGEQTTGQYVGVSADYRQPITNTLTLHVSGENDGIDNNRSFTEGYKIGVGVRVYLQD